MGGLKPIHPRHVDVYDNNIRLKVFRRVDAFAACRRLTANRPAWLASQHGSQPLTHMIVIVYQQNA